MRQNRGTVVDEAVVEIDQAEEFAELALHISLWKIADVTDLLVKGNYGLCGDSVSWEVEVGNSKHTLGHIDNNAILTEML